MKIYDKIKRVFDFCLASVLFFLLLPILASISLLIKLNSNGDVIYKAVRVGQHDKKFEMYKFRSMVSEAEQIGGFSSASSDFRITKIGKVLRRYKP